MGPVYLKKLELWLGVCYDTEDIALPGHRENNIIVGGLNNNVRS